MKILDRYLASQVISTILVASLALLGFDLFFNLVHELKVVGKGQYTLWVALTYLLLIIPGRLYAMFPWAALIGTLISLGSLASRSELVVMRTAAISVIRITGSVLKGAFLLMIIAVIFGEGVAPITERLAQNKRTWALSGGQTIQTAFGLWVRQGKEFIHVQSIPNEGELQGVTRYQFDGERKLIKATYAEKAIREGNHWKLTNVRGTEFLSKHTKTFEKEIENVSDVLEPTILETALVKHPERLSIIQLWKAIHHHSKNDLNTQNYEIALWSKLFQPVIILMMVFIAVPFIFGPLRSVSTGFRVVSGVLVAFLFHTLNNFFTPLAVVYQLPSILAVVAPIIVFSGVGFWMLHRVK